MKPLSLKAQKLIAKTPTKLGHVQGCVLYENPTSGQPLLMIDREGQLVTTDFTELPTAEELDYWMV